MTTSTAIEFSNVSKCFARHTGRMLLRNYFLRWLDRGRRQEEPFYALSDVSFRINHRESVAIVGSNGAGKSTLLSMVAGLAPPDSGQLYVHGRVAALLELGSGFHYDLTGAENLRLNASLLGISRKRTNELYDQIVDFAGIGDFMEEPLRTYSSGMVIRLAFSVAIHMDPEILIIDEVLAVGDQAFQQKCLDKIMELRQKDITLLCVSHSGQTVRQFCERGLWLDHGQLIMEDSIDEVVAAYEGRRFPYSSKLEG
jgi:ABC-type polysaccharide/polyol phosphate transport system ATPase subunit